MRKSTLLTYYYVQNDFRTTPAIVKSLEYRLIFIQYYSVAKKKSAQSYKLSLDLFLQIFLSFFAYFLKTVSFSFYLLVATLWMSRSNFVKIMACAHIYKYFCLMSSGNALLIFPDIYKWLLVLYLANKYMLVDMMLLELALSDFVKVDYFFVLTCGSIIEYDTGENRVANES